MMKITGLSHIFKWENLHNWWLTKLLFFPTVPASVNVFKGVVHQKINSVNNYSPSCCSSCRITESSRYFCFLCTQIVLSQLHKITVIPLISHELFYRCP